MAEVKKVVKEVVSDAQKEVNELAAKGVKALEAFLELDQEQVDFIVAKASVAAINQHGELALKAVEETKRGVFEDKATKNMFASEYIVNNIRDLKTVGIIGHDEVEGITEIAEPVGVVAGVTPVTNPTSTTIFKALIALKTRNPIIFGFHPSAQNCSAAAAKVVLDAAVAAGAPKNCIQWISKPSMEGTGALMNHPDVATILATGGNAMVKAAYSCGKPALGVGAGNVPAYMEESCNVKQAVNDIVMSKAFDNGMICASEQAAIIDKEIYDESVEEFKSLGVYFCSKKEKEMLEEFCFGVKAASKNWDEARLNPNIVGQSAFWIAKQAGFKVPEHTNILAAECKLVGPKEPLTREKLSPVLAILKSNSFEEGLKLSAEMVEFNGLGHSAAIHTENEELAQKFGFKVKAIRVIWNAPSTFGGIGDVYNSFIPSLTLGCGSYGKNSVSNNVSALNLINIKRIGQRRNNMQWFKIPSKIYFEKNSIKYLQDMADIDKVFIVTDQAMENLGFVKKITDQLAKRPKPPMVQIFSQVEPNPDITTIRKGVEVMRNFAPDVIIALGGGSPMDAAKGMWLFYEHPEVAFEDLKEKFIDIRKRAFKIPALGKKARLVCIPTTSGTGSEVTPFTVISDKANKKKYPVADYAVTPSVAIVDPALTRFLPKGVTAASALDALTHSIEAYVSIMANDFTDGLCLKAIKLIFEYLPRAVANGANDMEAREKIHNAATIAGMAFANSFLGIVHSMSHKLGGEYHFVHGDTNAVLLPYVIRYNGTKPQKLSTWPKYNFYKADVKYQEIAQSLGLKARTPEEGVKSLAIAVRELVEKIGSKSRFQDFPGDVDAKTWENNLEKMALLAYEDQCSPANPRLPMISDMVEIMRDAYTGENLYDYVSDYNKK